jgi:hypothetical protein
VTERPWDVLLFDYNVFDGRVWIAVVMNTLFSPLLIGTIMRNKS